MQMFCRAIWGIVMEGEGEESTLLLMADWHRMEMLSRE